MPFYLVALQVASAAHNLVGGADAMVVWAASEAQAKERASAQYDGDGGAWTAATATDLTVSDDWEGWTFTISINTTVAKTFTYVGTSANDTVDEIAAQLVILLNADADIAGAAYNTTTQVLTVAETTDGLGNHTLTVDITPPSGKSACASLRGTLVHEGAAGDALKVTLSADALVPPKVVFVGKRV